MLNNLTDKKMKTIKLTMVVAIIVAAFIVSAVEKPQMSITPISAEKAVVTVLNENPAFFEISFRAANGDLVYYKQSSNPSHVFRQVYDFKDLDAGKYVLTMNVNDTRVVNHFEITRKGIEVGKAKIHYSPYFEFENDELKFSYLNFDQENMKLSIYGSHGLVYESRIGREFNLTRGYDLSRLESDAYSVRLSSFNHEYSFDIVK